MYFAHHWHWHLVLLIGSCMHGLRIWYDLQLAWPSNDSRSFTSCYMWYDRVSRFLWSVVMPNALHVCMCENFKMLSICPLLACVFHSSVWFAKINLWKCELPVPDVTKKKQPSATVIIGSKDHYAMYYMYDHWIYMSCSQCSNTEPYCVHILAW